MLATTARPGSSERAQLLRLQLMGDFRVVVGEREIDASVWKLRKAAAIVKLLALDPSRQLHHEHLMDLLWPDVEPDAAANNLRRTLHVARRILMPERDVPSPWLRRHGDVLSLGPRELVATDVDAFEAAVQRLRDTVDITLYRQAIDLYTGDLLPEDRYEEWAEQRRMALRASYLALLARLSAICEEAGQIDDATEVLQRLVALDPAHEDAHVGLMRLYAVTGQRRRALSQYQHLRDALQRELDVEPAESSQQLYHQILRGQLPVHVPSVPVALVASGRAGQPPTNLPIQLTSFIGRDDLISEIAAALTPSDLDDPAHTRRTVVTLTGPGGSGKTRLAIEVARRLSRAFSDGVWLVELAPLHDPALLSLHVLAGIPPIRETSGRTATEALIGWFRERRALLVLDNCEHLIDACARLVETLVHTCPGLTILTTSRESLRIPGESLWPVPPMPFPAAGHVVTSESLRALDGPRLFLERAQAAQPHFAVTQDSAALVADICRKLDGLPLAIELAATRVRVLTLEQIDQRLDDALRLLTDGARTAPARHHSLRATLDWSYDLLTQQEQTVLRRLSVFAGGCQLDAAEAVCAETDIPTEHVLDLLAHLVDKSLIEVDETGSQARYRLLEPIRQYALEQSIQTGERDSLRDRHLQWCIDLAVTSFREFGKSPEVIRYWALRLEDEIDNSRAGLRWALHDEAPSRRTSESVNTAIHLALNLHWLWQDGHTIEARSWFERLLEVAGHYDVPVQMVIRVIDQIGFHARRSGSFAVAEAMHIRALSLAQDAGLRFEESMTLWGLAAIAREQADYSRANACYQTGLSIMRELEFPEQLGQQLVDWGDALVRQDDVDRAEACLLEAIAISETNPNLVHLRGQTLAELTGVAHARGDLETARAWADESLAFSRSFNRNWAIANSLNKLGRVALAQGDDLVATAAWCESAERFHAQGDQRFIPCCLEGLARAACERSEHAQATTLLGAGNAIRVAIGTPLSTVDQPLIRATMSTLRRSLGDEAFDRLYATGDAMHVDDAVAFALQTAVD